MPIKKEAEALLEITRQIKKKKKKKSLMGILALLRFD